MYLSEMSVCVNMRAPLKKCHTLMWDKIVAGNDVIHSLFAYICPLDLEGL